MIGITNIIPCHEGGVSIIEFTIANGSGTSFTYQCEDGMTWEEFVNSDYNTNNNFSLTSDGYVSYVESSKTPLSSEDRAISTEKIIDNHIYYYLTSMGINYVWN